MSGEHDGMSAIATMVAVPVTITVPSSVPSTISGWVALRPMVLLTVAVVPSDSRVPEIGVTPGSSVERSITSDPDPTRKML